jgi:hypothetical protein
MRRLFAWTSGAFLAGVIAFSCGTDAPPTNSVESPDAAVSQVPPSTGSVDSGSSPTVDAGCAAQTTCEKAGVHCGSTGDGCGGTLQCGTCQAPETCGGGGVSGVCGVPPCQPKTCAELGANCGFTGDGCGQQIDCGKCTGNDTCGGGGKANVCGAGPCTPKTCEEQAVNCGAFGDGCGNPLPCGSCGGNESCGGGGIPNVCGAPPCTPKKCEDLGYDCGPTSDGCGDLLQCGACNQPETCGGGGNGNKCEVPSTCTGLCLQQVTCPNPAVTTTVSGTVYAPNGTDPLVNALVYIPNSPVQAFTPGVSCDTCAADASGSPLVRATTGADGKFVLKNAPVGTNIPLVIQLGRWRRQVTVPTVTSCTNTPVAASSTRLPKNKSEGDIPLMAFATGAVDALECVLRKIGVDDSEFTAPDGGGRIHLYEGLTDHTSQNATATTWASGGAKAVGSPNEDQLWSTQAALNQYDTVFFPCQNDQANPALRSATAHQNLVNYANAGGRIFATHFSYIWLYQTAPFSATTQWNVEQHPSPANQDGYLDTTFPKGKALAQWLVNVGASTTSGQIPLQVIRHDYDDVVSPSKSWMTIDDDPNFPGASVQYTFNTPVGAPAAQQCGRVFYNDFHVENVSFAPTIGAIFPAECASGPMTAQEKLLEYMIFDLAACVTPDAPDACVAKTCPELGVNCGPTGDGCGGLLQCGGCPDGQTCGGGGIPSVCGAATCKPKSCADQGIQCGPAGDGCGRPILCGSCPGNEICGGGGQPGVCGNQACTPKSCAQQGIQCGSAGDGCGNPLQCGSCPGNQTCGGGGQPGVCGATACTPKTCAELGANCGPVGDGCGNVIQCGTCSPPQTCGGGGAPSVCGGNGPM